MKKEPFWGTASSLRVEFRIRNLTLSIADVSTCLGVKPTDVIEKGSRLNPRVEPALTNTWILESDLNIKLDTEEQVEALLPKLDNYEQLKRLDPGFHAILVCIVYFVGEDSRPTIGLTAGMMKRLGEMECGFDVDYYLFPDGERPE